MKWYPLAPLARPFFASGHWASLSSSPTRSPPLLAIAKMFALTILVSLAATLL